MNGKYLRSDQVLVVPMDYRIISAANKLYRGDMEFKMLTDFIDVLFMYAMTSFTDSVQYSQFYNDLYVLAPDRIEDLPPNDFVTIVRDALDGALHILYTYDLFRKKVLIHSADGGTIRLIVRNAIQRK